MNNIRRASRLLGAIWAAAMIALSVMLPHLGSWTIDDSVKRIAAENGTGFWADRLPDGPVRSRLAHPDENAPLHPPFALRTSGALESGFSPWTRALYKAFFSGGQWLWRLAPAVIAILLWIVLEGSNIPFAFLLLPLTFYGLIPWEHALSWLLLWPAVWLVLGEPTVPSPWQWFASGVLLSMASALRPETVLLVAALPLYLFTIRSRTKAAWLSGGISFGALTLLIWFLLTGNGSAFTQLAMNFPANKLNFLSCFLNRGDAIYSLLLQADRNMWISLIILALLIFGAWITLRAQRRKSKLWILGFMLLLTGIALYQRRLWSSPIPVLAILKSNSLTICLPWILLLVSPPYRDRAAFKLAMILAVTVLLVTPVWEGVHWGPRILLFLLPLLLIDLRKTRRAAGLAFTLFLIVMLIQSVGSAALVYARMRETADRVALARVQLGNPVICPTMSQCTDLAPLWKDHEFFTAADPRELRRLLCEMRFAGLDTVWLHTAANDPLFSETFPQSRPVVAARITFLQAKSLYTTQWRIFEMAMNRQDTSWAEVLEKSAGEYLLDERSDDALRLQREAVRLTPESASRHHNLALIFTQMGRTDEARNEAQTAIDLNPDLEQPHRLLEMLSSPSQSAP